LNPPTYKSQLIRKQRGPQRLQDYVEPVNALRMTGAGIVL
jgi:hypothetical protein